MSFLEALCKIRVNGEAMQVYYLFSGERMVFISWKDRISTSQIMQGTGLSKKAIERARETLRGMKFNKYPQKRGASLFYSIQKNYDLLEGTPKKGAPTKKYKCPPKSRRTTPLIKWDTKDNKDNIQKKTAQ